jgi:hypothetical protein
LFVGDDWAEDHHDVEVVGEDGQRLGARRVPEGPGGIAALHALIGRGSYGLCAVGIHTYGAEITPLPDGSLVEANSGTRITNSVYDNLKNWTK